MGASDDQMFVPTYAMNVRPYRGADPVQLGAKIQELFLTKTPWRQRHSSLGAGKTAFIAVKYLGKDRGEFVYELELIAKVLPRHINALMRNMEALVREVEWEVQKVSSRLVLKQYGVVESSVRAI